MTVSRDDASSTFQRLEARAAAGEAPTDGYVVETFGRNEQSIYLGCAADGSHALLVLSKTSTVSPPPLRLASLSADFGVLSKLSSGTSVESLRLSALRCTENEPSVAELFATVCAALADSMPSSPTEKEFSDEIGRWASLFWRLGQRVETDVVGLAGELVVLHEAQDPGVWISAWHSRPNDVLDFSFLESPISVEVKTTRGSKRNHIVSLGQIMDPGLSDRYFASVHIALNASGALLSDIVRGLSDRLSSDKARLALWGVLTSTCGEALTEVLSRRIDLERAAISLRFYRGVDIPVPLVELPLPSGVSDVKFTSDFGGAPELMIKTLEERFVRH